MSGGPTLRLTEAPAHRRTDAPLVVRRLLGALFLGCVGASVPRFVAAQDAAPILARAVAEFAKVTTLRAEFVQTLRDPMIGTNAGSRGELMQQRPDKFVMRWRQPAGDVLLADGQWLWVYLPSSAPGQVVKSAMAGRPGQNPDVIAEFLERPNDRFTVSFVRAEPVGSRPADVLRFVPRGAAAGPYRSVLLWIDRGDALPRQVEITEAGGAVRRITLDRLRVNSNLPANSFVFRPPANVRIVDASQP